MRQRAPLLDTGMSKRRSLLLLLLGDDDNDDDIGLVEDDDDHEVLLLLVGCEKARALGGNKNSSNSRAHEACQVLSEESFIVSSRRWRRRCYY